MLHFSIWFILNKIMHVMQTMLMEQTIMYFWFGCVQLLMWISRHIINYKLRGALSNKSMLLVSLLLVVRMIFIVKYFCKYAKQKSTGRSNDGWGNLVISTYHKFTILQNGSLRNVSCEKAQWTAYEKRVKQSSFFVSPKPRMDWIVTAFANEMKADPEALSLCPFPLC